MDDPSMNQYEQQLYSVFKSFDVNNEESLDESAVNNLCDALQLEERGAALVDTLFEKREGRVSFAQFRSGLLAVLGEPRAAPAPAPPAPPDPPPGTERELAPRFVFGAKQYGRRSRPHSSTGEERPEPRAASASRVEGEERRPRYRRSASAAERRGTDEPALDHDRRIDRDEALALCRSLRMHSIDRRLVERIFDDSPTPETTVGEFFERLNCSLGSAMDESGEEPLRSAEEDGEPSVERVVEAWEAAGVSRPRRLLVELGCAGGAVRAVELERALDVELRALECTPEARGDLLAAALSLARLRAAAADTRRSMLAAERDKLRSDVSEANERARLLAQEVDESHARIEHELKASLKRAEAEHAEQARRARDEAAAQRERADAERARADGEAARRQEAEARLHAAAEGAQRRADEAEARAALAEERVATLERAHTRTTAQLRAAEAACADVAGAERAAAGLATRVAELQRDNLRLRDRCDEACAALEAASRPAPTPAPSASRGGGALAAELRSVLTAERPEEDAPTPDPLKGPTGPAEAVQAEPRGDASVDYDVSGDESYHDEEKQRLTELVKELESSLELMRGEYEACEEYWSGKLAEERAAHDAEARAAEARLAELVARIHAFERRLLPAPRLPPIAEAPHLEAQVAHVEAEFERHRREAAEQLAALRERLARAERRAARPAPPAAAPPAPAPAPCPRCVRLAAGGAAGAAGALAARCARAEGAVRRLQARLAAADTLVKELYVENCQLAHARPLPL